MTLDMQQLKLGKYFNRLLFRYPNQFKSVSAIQTPAAKVENIAMRFRAPLRLRCGLSCVGALAAVLFAPPAQAAERGAGFYLLGSHASAFAGILPPPGLYFENDLYLYEGSTGGNLTLPFGGRIIADVDADVIFELPIMVWSTPWQIWGGNVAFQAIFPVGSESIDAGVELASPLLGDILSQNLHDSVDTVGDPVIGSTIGWHSGNYHWTLGALVNVPIGIYNEGEIANISFHRWGVDLTGAFTWFDPKIGFDFSAAIGITFNGENPSTDYRTGDEFHLELSATKIFKNGLSLGPALYYYDQVTGDSGSGARLGDFEGRVLGVGGTVGYTFKVDNKDITARLKAFKEMDVENRLEGEAAYVTLSIPLGSPAAQMQQQGSSKE
jgi:hypothetical protein